MAVKKRKGQSIKEMLFTYLAISKILYWIGIISEGHDFEGIWRVVSQRLLEQDIVLILVVVFIHFSEKKFVLIQKKWRGILAQIVFIVSSYFMFIIIMLAYEVIISLIFSMPFNIVAFLLSADMRNWTIIFFIIAFALISKENFKKKEAAEYALDIQTSNIQLEMLEVLLADGVLSQEEFDKQKMKLHEF